MENKEFLFKNYTKSEMDFFADNLKAVFDGLLLAMSASTSKDKGFYLNAAYVALKNIPEDNELVCMLLMEVHELNKKQVKTSFGHFNFLETIFGHKGDGELSGK